MVFDEILLLGTLIALMGSIAMGFSLQHALRQAKNAHK